MKMLFIPLFTILVIQFTSEDKAQDPVNKVLKLKWEVEITTKNIIPPVSGDYILTADKFAVNGSTGQKVSFPFKEIEKNDSMLIYDNGNKLEIINVKNNQQILNTIRRRARYVGKTGVEIVRDSIWIEVDYKMNIQAKNLFTQNNIWAIQSPYQIVDRPIIYDNKIFVVNKEEILILNKSNGDILSHFLTGGQVLSELTPYEDYLYFIVRNVGLVAYSLSKNSIQWKFNLVSYSGHINKIIVDQWQISFADNNLYTLNRNDGSIIWKMGEDSGIFIKRPDHLTIAKNYIIFYAFKDNENVLTVANKNTGKILYQGLNSSVLGGDSNNSDGVSKEDLLLIDFVDVLIDEKILIGVLDNKIYGLEVMK